MLVAAAPLLDRGAPKHRSLLCRELSSFVFVLESANRIAVEKPCYGHATYFFDLEEPLSVSEQVGFCITHSQVCWHVVDCWRTTGFLLWSSLTVHGQCCWGESWPALRVSPVMLGLHLSCTATKQHVII